jgi:ribonuclease P protein component
VKRSLRLKRTSDFERVRRLGTSYAHPLLVLVVLPNETLETRWGFAAGRSVGGAVQRNRAKRRLRETARLQNLELPTGYDLVLIARQPILQASFPQIQNALQHTLQRAHLLKF